MKRTLLFLFLVCAFAACKKHTTDLPICAARPYGYKAVYRDSAALDSSARLGEIYMKASTSNSIALFPASIYNTQGVYANDLSYYVFRPKTKNDGVFVLYNIHLTGTVKPLRYHEYIVKGFYGLVYSGLRNKLYCFKQYDGGGFNISEIVMTDSTFVPKKLCNISGTGASNTLISSTIVDNNGLIYFVLDSYPNYSIVQFTIKDSSVKTICLGRDAYLLGLQFNPNDNMLYALRRFTLPAKNKTELIKITTQGTISALGDLSFNVDTTAYSSCFDRCNNVYIVSSLLDSKYSTLSILDMNGTQQKHDTLLGMYQGLYVP